MYSREEIKALSDKVLAMAADAKADGCEVTFQGGEQSATRWANSSITTNLVQYDQQLGIAIRAGSRSGNSTTREFDDESLRAAVAEAKSAADRARENPNLAPLVKGPQDYLRVDAVQQPTAEFGPGERAAWVKQSVDICDKKGVLGAGYIPKAYQTQCIANSEGLFGYYQYAEVGFILTCRMPTGSGSGWAGITGAKDLSQVDVAALTNVAADKAVRSQKPRAIEPGRYTTILEPRPAARFLSTMMGAFNGGTAGGGGFGGGGGFNFGGVGRPFINADGTPKVGQKLFSDAFTLKSDVGNSVLRQTPIMNDGMAAKPVTWIEKGVLTNVYYDAVSARRAKVGPSPATPNMSLVVEGSDQTLDDLIKSTRRGLLVTFFWYLRPVDTLTLLQTGMTRDGLFLIENGEIAGPVQNFRWNMSPLVAFANISGVGKAVPIHTGEAYDGPGTALVPALRIEDFYMTSVSPAV
ncbi:MAG TPA: metallopeptidase TldD-related protein [Vicinamibacterales bacterium]|nr:metallopeptidase TldD-related protein [Vicinamibacterales bacterium]